MVSKWNFFSLRISSLQKTSLRFPLCLKTRLSWWVFYQLCSVFFSLSMDLMDNNSKTSNFLGVYYFCSWKVHLVWGTVKFCPCFKCCSVMWLYKAQQKEEKINYSCSIKLSEGCNLKISYYTKGHKSAKIKILELSMSFCINIWKDEHFVTLVLSDNKWIEVQICNLSQWEPVFCLIVGVITAYCLALFPLLLD